MERLLAAIKAGFRGEIFRDELLLSHTSWRIGGPAQLFLIPADSNDLLCLLQLLKRHQFPWMVIGNGTNLLVQDGGVAGAVISLQRFDRIEMNEQGQVRVGAGVSLPQLIRETVVNGLQGLEELTGIPGSVGGALLMNAGAGEVAIGSLVESLTLVDAQGEKRLSGAEISFNYRDSGLQGQGIITSACLQLQLAKSEDLQIICREKLERRRQVQSVGAAHAGSVFKNPREDKAWKLIAAAGLRGERCGDAEISSVHCNHIVNLGHATAQDVMSLIELARRRVLEQSGIELELEVHVVGQEVCGDR